jgi:hypothetical protein
MEITEVSLLNRAKDIDIDDEYTAHRTLRYWYIKLNCLRIPNPPEYWNIDARIVRMPNIIRWNNPGITWN